MLSSTPVITPVREQTELGVTSGLRGSSLTGWGRVSAWGPHSDTDWGSGSKGHNSTTDCSAQRRRPCSLMASLNDMRQAAGDFSANRTGEVSTQEVLRHRGTVRMHSPSSCSRCRLGSVTTNQTSPWPTSLARRNLLNMTVAAKLQRLDLGSVCITSRTVRVLAGRYSGDTASPSAAWTELSRPDSR